MTRSFHGEYWGGWKLRTAADKFTKYDDDKSSDEFAEFDSLVKDIATMPRKPATDTLSPEERARRAEQKERDQSEEKLMRMRGEDEGQSGGKFDFEPVDGEQESDAEDHSELEGSRFDALLAKFCSSKTREGANESYNSIAQLVLDNGSNAIDLGRSIRKFIATSMQAFQEKLETGQKSLFPDSAQLLLIKLVGYIYSTSDAHHVIVTPTMLLSAIYLTLGRISKTKHLIIGLEICKTLLEFVAESKAYIPEVFRFLATVFCALGYPENGIFLNIEPSKELDFVECCDPWDIFSETTNASKEQLKTMAISILHTAAKDIYSTIPSFPEIFGSFMAQLGDLIDGNDSLSSIKRQIDTFKREPLRLQEHKPIPLPQLEPELEIDRKVRHRVAVDKKSELKRLKTAVKKETKGAKKELRRDAAFLARHQKETRSKSAFEYKEKINRIYGNIGNGN